LGASVLINERWYEPVTMRDPSRVNAEIEEAEIADPAGQMKDGVVWRKRGASRCDDLTVMPLGR
jgi:hypothetical protein